MTPNPPGILRLRGTSALSKFRTDRLQAQLAESIPDLEALRTEIEDAVDGAEGMLGLAVTRALTDPEGNGADGLPWSGARDDGVVEASCLWETYDWLKRNENCSDDAISGHFHLSDT